KAFGENEMILALGVTMTGDKIILGMIESNTENELVCSDFLRGLIERGLNTNNEILCVIDGGKGIRKAIKTVLGEKAFIERCQWHKRENILSYLNPGQREPWRRKLQAAYDEHDYESAKN